MKQCLNLETMIDSGEAAKVVNIPTLGSRAEENRYDFFTSEKYRMTNHRSHTIFFTSEKNRMTNQIISRF